MKDLSHRIKSHASLVLRLAVSFGVLYYVFHSSKIEPQNLWKVIRHGNPSAVLLGLGIYAAAVLLTFVRWHLMLHTQQIPLPFKRTAHISAIGLFFNSFMLGSTGGDLIKAWYVARETQEKKTAAVTTVFADRIFGLLGLFILSGIVALTHIPTLSRNPQLKGLVFLLLAFFLVSIIGLWVLAQSRLWEILFSTPIARKCLSITPTTLQHTVRKVYDAFHLYYQAPTRLATLLALSVAVHAALVLNAFILSKALQTPGPTLHDFFLIIPIVTFVASIPLSISGLGIRDQMIVFLLAAHGVPEVNSLALSLLIFGCVVTSSLVGGISYIFPPTLPDNSLTSDL